MNITQRNIVGNPFREAMREKDEENTGLPGIRAKYAHDQCKDFHRGGQLYAALTKPVALRT